VDTIVQFMAKETYLGVGWVSYGTVTVGDLGPGTVASSTVFYYYCTVLVPHCSMFMTLNVSARGDWERKKG